MEWNGGMDYWSGALDWTIGVVAYLSMRIILSRSDREPWTALMYEPRIISCLDLDAEYHRI